MCVLGFLLVLIQLTAVECVYSHKHPLNLTIAKEQVEQYHECGQYDRDLEAIVNKAIAHFNRVPARNNATVVFDIDDTVLSDYANEKEINFGYIPKLSHEWIMRADAPAIPQAKKLYDYLQKKGFKIIFLSGRKYDEYDASIKNLKEQGFTTFDKLIVRSKEEEKISAKHYKTKQREQLTQEGYRIVGTVGDQFSDIKGPYSGYRIKLPNYRYNIN